MNFRYHFNISPFRQEVIAIKDSIKIKCNEFDHWYSIDITEEEYFALCVKWPGRLFTDGLFVQMAIVLSMTIMQEREQYRDMVNYIAELRGL